MAGIAFFDMDKTLLAVNSASLWVRRELAQGHISRVDALRASVWVGLYGLGLLEAADVIRSAVRTLKGKRERDVLDRTLAFWDEEVKHTLRPGAREAVRRHRESGDLTFLLTSSSNYLSAPISDELKLDGFLSNRFQVDNGNFTGGTHEPVCYGPGKVAHAEACASKLHIALSECAFYTDSYSDVPMLEAVGRPFVVDPDVRLRRLARKRGWPVAEWGVPSPRTLTTATSQPAIPPPPPPPPPEPPVS